MQYKTRSSTRSQRYRNRNPNQLRSRSRCSTPISQIPPIKRVSSANHRAAVSSRQQKKRQWHHRRKLEARKLYREDRAALHKTWSRTAMETERIVRGTGQYVQDSAVPPMADYKDGATSLSSFSQIIHDISPQVELSKQLTTLYHHYSNVLANWQRSARPGTSTQTVIEFTSSPTLSAARTVSLQESNICTPASSSNFPTTRLGVLSFASAKKPKRGSSHGGEEQVDMIIRSSSLITNLLDSSAGQMFYDEHKKLDDGSGLHDHGMLYSPGVMVIRQDFADKATKVEDEELDHVVSLSSHFPDANAVARRQSADQSTISSGTFISPYTINVISAVPVSAGVVRSKHIILPEDKHLFEDGIRRAMKERMARILKLFESRGDKIIILGAFGCGCSSQNSVETVASIWAELLVCGDRDGQTKQEASFKDVFEKVVFAVPGKLFTPFKQAFDMRVFEEEVASAALDD